MAHLIGCPANGDDPLKCTCRTKMKQQTGLTQREPAVRLTSKTRWPYKKTDLVAELDEMIRPMEDAALLRGDWDAGERARKLRAIQQIVRESE